MAKRQLKNRRTGKTQGRSQGDLVYAEEVNRMVSPKLAAAIRSNRNVKDQKSSKSLVAN